jgi:sulfoxide reductase heme-binding subunit YedZ
MLTADSGVRQIAAFSARFAYALMCLTLVWGVLTATGWVRRLGERKTLRSGHMVLAVLTLAFGIVHAVSFLFITSGTFSLLMISVPMMPGTYFRHALGIVGLELMVAIAVTAGLHRWTAYRRWVYLHRLAYLAVPILAVHSVFGAIANGHLSLLWLAGITLLVPVVTLTVLRFLPERMLERIGLVEERI